MADAFSELETITPDGLNAMQRDFLPGELGLEVLEAREGYLRSRVTVSQKHMAPNGFLHAASLIALLDTAAGYGCRISLPQDAAGFTTIELKSNFLGTAKVGEKGQIVIPKDARQIFGVKPGDTLLILGDEETGIIVTKPDVLRDAADDIFGKMEK